MALAEQTPPIEPIRPQSEHRAAPRVASGETPTEADTLRRDIKELERQLQGNQSMIVACVEDYMAVALQGEPDEVEQAREQYNTLRDRLIEEREERLAELDRLRLKLAGLARR